MPRIPLVDPAAMTPEQRRVYEAVVAGPRGELRGPLRAALHRPDLADKWHQFGELLRFRTSLPPLLSELAILVTARACNCQVEWYIHEMMARKADLAAAVIDDLRVGRRPSALDADELVIYEYADALNRTKHVPEAIYRRALDRWDVVGVVELTALIGYYTMVAMTLNAHEIPLPDGAVPPLEPVAA